MKLYSESHKKRICIYQNSRCWKKNPRLCHAKTVLDSLNMQMTIPGQRILKLRDLVGSIYEIKYFILFPKNHSPIQRRQLSLTVHLLSLYFLFIYFFSLSTFLLLIKFGMLDKYEVLNY